MSGCAYYCYWFLLQSTICQCRYQRHSHRYYDCLYDVIYLCMFIYAYVHNHAWLKRGLFSFCLVPIIVDITAVLSLLQPYRYDHHFEKQRTLLWVDNSFSWNMMESMMITILSNVRFGVKKSRTLSNDVLHIRHKRKPTSIVTCGMNWQRDSILLTTLAESESGLEHDK